MVDKNREAREIPDAFILKFLSKAFLYPDEDFLNNLKSGLKELANEEETLNQIITGFQKEPLSELQAEYTRLFINGYPKTCCPPYESVYLEGQMVGQVNRIVMEIYQNWGFSVNPRLADHVSTELEFLAFLLTASEISEISDMASKEYTDFLTHHINRWIPQFTADLRYCASLDVYKMLSDFDYIRVE